MTTQLPDKPLRLFYSYVPNTKDDEWRKRLETALATLKRQGYITDWHAQNILAGDEKAIQLSQQFNEADIILLLISQDFIASDYCYNTEMQRAIERHNANEARVIPILLRPTDYVGTPFATLKPLPKNEKPLSRWRDKDDALLAVAQGIREVIQEMQTIASSATTSSSTHDTASHQNQSSTQQLWSVPYRRNLFFTGRETLLARLHTQLRATKAAALTQPQAISGLGGVGKTQIALEYAYQYRQDYRAIFWLKAASADTLRTDMVSLATVLNLPEKDEANQPKVLAAVQHWLSTHDHWLLILDNADDLAMVDTFLPTHSQGHILLTTRAQNSGKVADLIPVQEMAQQEGILLLLRRANLINRDDPLDKATTEQQAQTTAIYSELGGLPLALDQAAAYIQEMQYTLPAYLQLYRNHRQDLLQRRSTFGSHHPDYDHPEPVATTWSLSIQQLAQNHPDAITILNLCAFLDPDSIPTEILTHIEGDHFADEYTLNEALNALRTFSLIRYNPTDNLLSIHRLVQAVLQDTMTPDQQRYQAEQAIIAVNAVFPRSDVSTWEQCRRLLSNAELCAALIEHHQLLSEQVADFLIKIVAYYKDHALYAMAAELCQRILAIREKVLGEEHPDTAMSLNNLAYFYNNQGKYEQAESLYLRALAIYVKVLGAEHPNTATNLNNLAALYDIQGKYEQAEPLYQRTLAINEKVLGKEHLSTAISLHGLARLYDNQGQYEQAEPFYQRALAIREKALGKEHPDTAIILNDFALLYKNQGKYEQAKLLYQHALAIFEKTLGKGHPHTASSLYNLAALYHIQGQYEQAEPLYRQALAIYEKMLGKEHPDTRIIFESYLYLLNKMGRAQEAASLGARFGGRDAEG